MDSIPTRPNFIVIKTDQQRWDTLNGLGFKHMITPNMDRLMQEGLCFDHAFACGATCVASRAAFYTGLFAHNTGVYHFDPWTHIRTWLHLFRDNGYHLSCVGKIHHHPDEDSRMAFHEKINVENFPMMTDWDHYSNYLKAEGQPHPFKELTKDGQWAKKCASQAFPLDEKYHIDAFVGRMATRWINDYNKDEPFFLHVGFHGPHDPFDPPQRVLDQYDNTTIPAPIYKKDELHDKPPQYLRFRERFEEPDFDVSQAPQYGAGRMYLGDKTDEDIKRWRRHYYAKITFIDEQIGHIIKALEDQQLLENTVIIFTSDHGDNLGDHQLAYKWLLTEQSTRVPMIVRLPDQQRAGHIDRELFSQIDVGPTLLDYAGIKIPPHLDGSSQRQRIETGDPKLAPQVVYCMDNYMTMVRSRDRRLIHYAGQDHGEFYDIDNDPHEQNNLHDSPDYQEEIRDLKMTFFEWKSVSSYLGSTERSQHDLYHQRYWPEHHPYDPYVIAGPPRRPDSQTQS